MGIPIPFFRRGAGSDASPPQSRRKKKPPATLRELANETIEEWKSRHPIHPDDMKRRMERYRWEVRNRPDYTKSPEVEEEMARVKDPFGHALKKMNPEEREEALKMKEIWENSFEYKFEQRCLQLEKEWTELEMERNSTPARKEDTKMWRSLPPVPGPRGIPLVRKALSGENEAAGRIMDFLKEHLFGLWGYRQRPYPPDRPIDAQQAFGFKWLHKRYADFTMRSGGWYYKDRLGRTRGPMELVNMQTAWAGGLIDKNTFIWGEDMDEWAPIGMVYGLERCINRWDIKMVTLGLALVYKLSRGIPLTTPRKGHEPKTLQQLQNEALEDRERQRAVLRLNGGVWPGEREPTHTVFLWAGGSQLSDHLNRFSETMPDKFISYHMRKKLMKLCPALRPKDFINIEKVMDALTYQADWYREPLGTFNSRPDFEKEWFKAVKNEYLRTIDDVEYFFSCIDKAPSVRFPRKPGEKLIVEPKKNEGDAQD
ncbi:protein TIC 56, chloroplastic [Selaginella moellendorffii]|uniref:protein TIC 56, chloroplastic n=1 Tax=Selaginella moellendorffii TaxID=88036 RepID=UPI000D1D0EFD|nr:protein TIC 56, chloroplastic [Selaginella moellendorffii]XP_024539174.1 protein TIC 56, chloroplastic [Selaginella moellendorffii]|eukprot:XP_002962001.2 protein TIC 56, chloroplastic [Selaginella moellendorffii]